MFQFVCISCSPFDHEEEISQKKFFHAKILDWEKKTPTIDPKPSGQLQNQDLRHQPLSWLDTICL